MRKTKEQKAITLIALIITIVVLLILAVVAINAVTGDGIIQHASNAREDYEKAQDEEQELLSYYEQYLATEGNSGDWIQNKTVIKNVKTGQVLEVGDYVNYESGVATYKDENEKEKAWRILGVENGEILLVSAFNVTTAILGGKDDCYNESGVNELDEIGKTYDDGTGAVTDSGRSIKVKDINRVTGYNPLKTGTGEPYYSQEYGKTNQYLNKVTYTLKEDIEDIDGDGNTTENRLYYSSEIEAVEKASTYEDKYQKFIDIDGTELEKNESITVQSTYYRYYPTTLTAYNDEGTEIKGIQKGSKAYDLLFLSTETGTDYYWIGNSFANTMPVSVNFGIACVVDGRVDGYRLWGAWERSLEHTLGVRAVVKLESDVILEDRDNDKTYEIYY